MKASILSITICDLIAKLAHSLQKSLINSVIFVRIRTEKPMFRIHKLCHLETVGETYVIQKKMSSRGIIF